MKKLIFPALIILIIFGFYTNNKNKKLNIAKKICGEYFKTQDEKCLRNPKQYDSILARQDAKKQLQEYISKVKPILKRIDNLTINNTDINPFEYSPVSYSDLDSITDRTKLKGKKLLYLVIIQVHFLIHIVLQKQDIMFVLNSKLMTMKVMI